MSEDDSQLHPAEIARRKRQEEKHKSIYEKISRLKRVHFVDDIEQQTASLIFAINLTKSRETGWAILDYIEVDQDGKYLRLWQPMSIYKPSATEQTLLNLFLKELDGRLNSSECESLLPTISRLEKLFLLDEENKQLTCAQWSNKPAELTFKLNGAEERKIDFFIQVSQDRDEIIDYNQTPLAVPGLVVFTDNTIASLVCGKEKIVRECLDSFPFFDDVILRKLIEESGIRQLKDKIHKKAFTARLIMRTARYKHRGHEQLHADLFFKYEGMMVHETDERDQLYEKSSSKAIVRDHHGETDCKRLLNELSFRWTEDKKEEKGWKILPSRLDEAVKKLLAESWVINAEGKCYRPPVDYEVTIQSGHDWFELKAEVDFGSESIPLPQILKMWREGQEYVELGDGSFGLLPIEWLTNYTVLAELGHDENGQIIFSKSQVAMLQALLDNKAKVTADDEYENRLYKLSQISEINAVKAPEGFTGQLREYQQEALGWMLHLQTLGFGGILALDMGLGKTPTILSLLQGRIQTEKPSMVIVPRSLIFNWQAEAEKFTPDLKVMIWRGINRKKHFKKICDHNIILTTYGTICRDVELLQSIHFDYCILDESQAIKNSDTSNAKAVRAINCDYRIAMTGTPIENSLTELWSQFEFLNPKMLGNAGNFKKINAKKEVAAVDELRIIAQSLQPFLFRRTKEKVAKDLPGKSEVVLYCEMGQAQKKVYDELREYYRQEMAKMQEEESEGQHTQSSTTMLAALLRLRQAACYPGLINDSYGNIPSVKVEMLLEHLQRIIAEGHKVLIFSQFTSMLKIIQKELREMSIDHCYLDGQTNDRAGVVNEFQNNSDKKTFLISLKAGGVGLNLTAASYVFLIDPWWNPAIENQAVDRAYRIGQKKKVIAYRMVTKDTVEEKIMKMKQDKLELAEKITEYESSNTVGISQKVMKKLLD